MISDVVHQWSEGHPHQDLHLEKTLADLSVPAIVNVKFALQNALHYLPAPDFGDRIVGSGVSGQGDVPRDGH